MGPNKILNLSIVCRRFPCPVPPMTAQRSRKQGMSNWQKWVLHQMSKPRVYHQLKPKVLADWTSRILCKHSKERHEPTCKQSNIYVSVLFVSAFLLLYFWVLSFCIASWLILFSYFIVFISHVYNMIAFRLCFHYLHVLVVLQSWIDRCGTCLIWSEIRSAITAIFLFSTCHRHATKSSYSSRSSSFISGKSSNVNVWTIGRTWRCTFVACPLHVCWRNCSVRKVSQFILI